MDFAALVEFVPVTSLRHSLVCVCFFPDVILQRHQYELQYALCCVPDVSEVALGWCIVLILLWRTMGVVVMQYYVCTEIVAM